MLQVVFDSRSSLFENNQYLMTSFEGTALKPWLVVPSEQRNGEGTLTPLE